MTVARRLVAACALLTVLWGPASALAQDCTGASATGVGFYPPTAPAAGHIARIVITAPSTCPWSVLSDTGMLAVLPPASGTGTGQVNVELAPNPGGARAGFVTLTLGSQQLKFIMVQDACISQVSTPLPPWQSAGPLVHWVDSTGGRRYVKVAHDWRLRAYADLNSDGRDDLVWQHRTTGAIKASMMDEDRWLADTSFSPGAVPDTDWQIVGVGDFNRDGQGDLLRQHQTLGLVGAWLLRWTGPSTLSVIDGTLLSPGVVPDTDWKIAGVADLDRDGHADLLWHHQTQGLVAAWLMNGLTVREGTLLTPGQVTDTNWKLVGPR